MPLATRILVSLTSLLILLTIAGLVRKKRLDEKYAMLWMMAGAVMMILPLASNIVDMVSYALGFYYPPSFVFLMSFFTLLLLNLQLSVAISKLTKQNKMLSQRFAIMQQRLMEVEERKRI